MDNKVLQNSCKSSNALMHSKSITYTGFVIKELHSSTKNYRILILRNKWKMYLSQNVFEVGANLYLKKIFILFNAFEVGIIFYILIHTF